jgi:hypothetical protein
MKIYLKSSQICQNLPKHEKVLKFVYFHIVNIAIFGYIYLSMIANWVTSQFSFLKKNTHTHTYTHRGTLDRKKSDAKSNTKYSRKMPIILI